MAQFSVNSYSVEQIINWIRSKEIAIPEIQRPFVWDGKKVRDLIHYIKDFLLDILLHGKILI